MRRARKPGRPAQVRRVTARINEQIDGDVRLVAEDGTQLGVMTANDARAYAYERSIDLVEVAAGSDPPVCRAMDYGKWRYEEERKLRQSRRNQVHVSLKEVRMRPKIGSHDYEWKRDQALDFLQDGSKVKAVVLFRGREREHPERGRALIDRLAADIGEIGKLEGNPVFESRTMTAVFAPR
ncbi:MAG: translation initiation factor [Gaiellaceae bacterium]|nr:translation initiation factor [Gaiellaceae bacterium]